MSKNTTIMITKNTKKVLAAFGKKGDTYNTILTKILKRKIKERR